MATAAAQITILLIFIAILERAAVSRSALTREPRTIAPRMTRRVARLVGCSALGRRANDEGCQSLVTPSTFARLRSNVPSGR